MVRNTKFLEGNSTLFVRYRMLTMFCCSQLTAGHPAVVLSVLQELMRRGGLKGALAGKDEEGLVAILNYLVQHYFKKVSCAWFCLSETLPTLATGAYWRANKMLGKHLKVTFWKRLLAVASLMRDNRHHSEICLILIRFASCLLLYCSDPNFTTGSWNYSLPGLWSYVMYIYLHNIFPRRFAILYRQSTPRWGDLLRNLVIPHPATSFQWWRFLLENRRTHA